MCFQSLFRVQLLDQAREVANHPNEAFEAAGYDFEGFFFFKTEAGVCFMDALVHVSYKAAAVFCHLH